MTISESGVTAALGEAIARSVGDPKYQLWFNGKTKFTWEDGLLVVGVPNCFYQEWLQARFGEAVREAACAVLARPMQVRFTIDPELFQSSRKAELDRHAVDPVLAAKEAPPAPTPAPTPPRAPTKAAKRSRRWHRLNDFVVGPCNRLAHAAALSVVEEPGQHANPLVLHGPVGTGKTHLLEGVYAGLRRGRPDWRVCYVTAEDFTNRFVQAMRLGKLGAFRKQFRDADALLLDDLDFLAAKKATQEEFLHTFDTLQSDGKQVVVSCDCHPRLADDFPPELVDRLLGGAVWGLAPPDPETRLALLRARSTTGAPPIPEPVLSFLAEQLRGNVRELEGAVHAVRHLARVTGRTVDVPLTREALGDLLRHSVRVVQLTDVERAVCEVLGLAPAALRGKDRAWAVSHPRMLAVFLARKHTRAAYSEIGLHFGGRNHSTAVAAEKKVRQWLTDGGSLSLGDRRVPVRELVERVERLLQR